MAGRQGESEKGTAAGTGPAGAGALLAALAGRTVYDLGQTLEWGMPEWPNQPPFVLSLFRRHGDFERPGGFGAAVDVVSMCTHNGTHLDVLGHVSHHGRLHGGLDAGAAQRGPRGLRALGVETVSPLLHRGVLLDVAGARGVPRLGPTDAVPAAELAALAEARGLRIGHGDCVLVRTGWGRHWPDPDSYLSARTGAPGPDEAACRWLADQDVALVGADTPTVECFRPGGSGPAFPGHVLLLVERGIHLLENAYLEGLAAAGVAEFLFVCLPLCLVGATGSPVRPVAIA